MRRAHHKESTKSANGSMSKGANVAVLKIGTAATLALTGMAFSWKALSSSETSRTSWAECKGGHAKSSYAEGDCSRRCS